MIEGSPYIAEQTEERTHEALRGANRIPEAYAYCTLTFTPGKKVSTSLSGTCTRLMMIPHFGVEGDPKYKHGLFSARRLIDAYTVKAAAKPV